MRFSQFLDFVYSLWFCLKVFPLKQALVLPVNISRHVKVGKVQKGCIRLADPVRHNQIFIGHQGYSAIAEQQGLFNIEPGGKLLVKGSARFGQGVRIWVDGNAIIQLGENFYCNKNCLFRAHDNIIFGDDVLLGWDIEFNTADGHSLFVNGKENKNHESIRVGNHVWIASHVIFAKGAEVADDSVVASRSLVNKPFRESGVLIGGCPAHILKENVAWSL